MAFDFENLDDYLDHYTANSSTVIVDSNNGNGTLEFIGSDDAEFMKVTSLGDNALRFSSRGANSTSDVEIEGLAINRVRVEGRGGNDTIDGSAQENAEVALEIRGGVGNDNLTGGAGPDIFLFGTATENGRVETDVITNYDRGERDVVDLSGTDGVISTRVIAGDLHLTLGNDRDILVIQNVTSRDEVMFIL